MPNHELPAGDSSGNERNLGHLLGQALAAGVLVIDSKGQVRAANPRAIEILGSSHSSGIAQEVLPEEVRALVEQSLSTGEDRNNEQVLLRRAGAPARVVRVSTVSISQGKNTRLITILTDVTGLDDLEQHVQRLHRVASVGTSAAGMAHEIKNALVAVRTFIDLLIEQHPGNEMAEMASREVRRINSLASQMLKLAGPSKVTFERIKLHEVLEHALGLVQVPLAEKHITLVRQFRTPRTDVEGDAYQLEQAFVNLFLNAIEAMSEGGKLSVCTDFIPPDPANQIAFQTGNTAACEGQQHRLISLTVSDTGTGIPPENMERLFDTFFTTKPTGTGLGLTITRRIIRGHKGEIQVYSQLGKGTTFTVLLPVMPESK